MGDNFDAFEEPADDSTDKGTPVVEAPPVNPATDTPPVVDERNTAKPRLKLPEGVRAAKPANDAPKGKGKGAKAPKVERVSHEDRQRFADFAGDLLDEAYDGIAKTLKSPIRATNRNPDDPNNGLIYTVKFRDTTDKAIAAAEAKPEGMTENLKASLVRMLALESPGRNLAYHAAAIMPKLARLDQTMQEHPFLTMGAILIATSVQFGLRLARTQNTERPNENPDIKVTPPRTITAMASGEVHGTLAAFVGPPGVGKTYGAIAIALQVARDNGLPFLAIDPAGEVAKYVEGFAEYARENGDRETLEWLTDSDCVRCLEIGEGAFTMEEALAVIRNLIADCIRRKVTTPQCVVFLDELAQIREVSPEFQNVTIPRARNAGVYFFGTCQTMVGMTPKARTCVRVLVVYMTTSGGVEVFGQWLDNKVLTGPQSDSLSYVTPWDSTVNRFDLSGKLPLVLSTPVVPTQLVKRRL